MSKQGAWALHATVNANASANSTFTNMPAADTFLFSSYRNVIKLDLDGMTQIRLGVVKLGTAGQAGAKLILRYSETFSTNVANYIDVGTSEVSVAVDTTNTYLDSGWIDIADDAKRDVFIAVVGSGGNGVLDPIFGTITVQAV